MPQALLDLMQLKKTKIKAQNYFYNDWDFLDKIDLFSQYNFKDDFYHPGITQVYIV